MIAADMASGKLLAHEAESLSNIVGNFARTLEVIGLEDRLAALEQGRIEDAKERHRYDA
jgi:hypothetical protein